MLRSRTSTPLIAFLYMPSTVRTVLDGSWRSNPSDMPRYCGYLKFGSVVLTRAVHACPGAGGASPAQALGSCETSPVNAGVFSALQLSVTRPRPVLAKALPSRM